MNKAIGVVEMFGFVTAITAADAAAKAADVKVIAIDSNKPADPTVDVPVIMAIKVEGEVSAVKAAVDAAVDAAESVSGVICSHVLTGPTDDAVKMAQRTSVGRDIVGQIKNGA